MQKRVCSFCRPQLVFCSLGRNKPNMWYRYEMVHKVHIITFPIPLRGFYRLQNMLATKYRKWDNMILKGFSPLCARTESSLLLWQTHRTHALHEWPCHHAILHVQQTRLQCWLQFKALMLEYDHVILTFPQMLTKCMLQGTRWSIGDVGQSSGHLTVWAPDIWNGGPQYTSLLLFCFAGPTDNIFGN